MLDIKKNKFKIENFIKLSISIRRTREAAKSLKIDTSNLKIKIKNKTILL